MLKTAVKFLLLTEAFAVTTFALGWWGVPALAFVWGLVVEPSAKPARFATICAAAGWFGLLLLNATRGPVGEVATRLGGVMGLPPLALYGTTLLFPGLLAWSAASVAASVAAPGRKALLARRRETGEMDVPAHVAARPIPAAGDVAIADV